MVMNSPNSSIRFHRKARASALTSVLSVRRGWPNFSPAEIACRGTGKPLVNEPALQKLQALRDRLGKPLIVRAAYRGAEQNRAVGGALWRIVGVLIVVPVLAVCIIVFGRIPSMRPVAVLPSSDGRVETG